MRRQNGAAGPPKKVVSQPQGGGGMHFKGPFLALQECGRKGVGECVCVSKVDLLKHEGGQALLTVLESFDLSGLPPPVVEAHGGLVRYIRSNLHRMDYPTYVAKGWHIGSGMIESACKTVVGQRLNQSGMRWRPPGTTELCPLRALYKARTTSGGPIGPQPDTDFHNAHTLHSG
jgi:hypothetical protein